MTIRFKCSNSYVCFIHFKNENKSLLVIPIDYNIHGQHIIFDLIVVRTHKCIANLGFAAQVIECCIKKRLRYYVIVERRSKTTSGSTILYYVYILQESYSCSRGTRQQYYTHTLQLLQNIASLDNVSLRLRVQSLPIAEQEQAIVTYWVVSMALSLYSYCVHTR